MLNDGNAMEAIFSKATQRSVRKVDQNALNRLMEKDEQKRAVEICKDLLAEPSIDEIISGSEGSETNFCIHFGIDQTTLHRWKTEGMTSYERKTLILQMCWDDLIANRVQQCPTCGRVYLAYIPEHLDGICLGCRSEILQHTDDFLRTWKSWR